jgi:hypothetical protein
MTLLVILVFGCTTAPKPRPETLPAPKGTGEISVMNFNVENLFDNLHDSNKQDQTYLPLSKKHTKAHLALCNKMENKNYREQCLNLDWSNEAVEAKLKNLAEVILSVDGQGPDILVLEEVENERILSQLNKKYLAKAGYVTEVLIEGFDERGIDVALLSRLPQMGMPSLHRIPYQGKDQHDIEAMAKSRGILEVQLKTPAGAPLTVLGAHFPSQQNPRYWREQAVEFLKKLVGEKSLDKNMVLVSGDLNITRDEDAEAGFFRGPFSEVAYVSHLVGCHDCEGTYNYRHDWSFLDILMFSKNMGETGSAVYRLEPDSIRVVGNGGLPERFNLKSLRGASDHFPIYGRIQVRP